MGELNNFRASGMQERKFSYPVDDNEQKAEAIRVLPFLVLDIFKNMRLDFFVRVVFGGAASHRGKP